MSDVRKGEQEQTLPVSPELKQEQSTALIMWNKLDWTARILIIGLILFLFYLAYMTQYEPNTTYYTNITDEYNFSTLKEIPQENATQYQNVVTMIKYKPNDFVPKQGITYNYSLIASIWLLAIIIYLLSKLFLRNAMITERQAKHILKSELEHKKHVLKEPEFDGEIKVGPAVLLREFQISENEIMPHMYIIGCKIINRDDVEDYYVGLVHPYTCYIYGILPSTTEFRKEDICGQCGKYPWIIKFIDTKMFAEFRRRMRGMGREPSQ